MRATLLLLAALIGVTIAGQGYLFPQSACRVHCHNGGACAYDTDDPSIHSCICLVGVYEGDRCERLVPGAIDPAAATTTMTTPRPTQPPTPSAYEIELRRHEEQRIRHMEERRKHEEERKRMEEERRRLIEERARQEEARRQEMENRGREEETRRRQMEEEHRRRADEERRREEDRRREEERRLEEEERREKEDVATNNQEAQPDSPHRLDYEEYDDSLDGERMEEVPDERNTVDEDEDEDDIDHVEAAEMEKQKEEEEDEEDEEEEEVVTPTPTTAVTYEVEHDYITSTTPTVHQEANHDDSKMSGEDDDYWDHTPEKPFVDEEGNKELPPLPGASTEDVVRGTQIDQAGRTVGEVGSLDEDEDVLEDGDDGWMMVKKKQTADSSSSHHIVLTTTITVLLARWLL